MKLGSFVGSFVGRTVDTVVIGAGQCGLAVARHLAAQGKDFVVLDRSSRVGSAWRRYMDSQLLVTPSAVNGLPGLKFPGSGREFPHKNTMADYLENYADHFGLPCGLETNVRRVSRDGDVFRLEVTVRGTQEHTLEARNVVVAVGFLHSLQVPRFAAELDPGITQLRMTEYHNPAQVAGPVLVIGAGNSGVQISADLAPTHEVWLAGPDPGHFLYDLSAPVFWRLAHWLLTADRMFGRRFIARKLRAEPPVIKISERRLRRAGVRRIDWIDGQADGFPVRGERVFRPATIIWTTGFRSDFGWLDLPVLGADGLPVHRRGVTGIEGLYFLGLPFQYGFTSHFIGGVDRDAGYVAAHIARRESKEYTGK